MIFNDVKFPQETIQAQIRNETHGDLVEIELRSIGAEFIYLTKNDARSFGEHLIALSESDQTVKP